MEKLYSIPYCKHIKMSDPDYDIVVSQVRETYPSACVLFISKVDNHMVEGEYNRTLEEIKIKYGEENTKIERVYHGTHQKHIKSIITKGFDPSYNKRSAYGKGTYFAKMGTTSLGYTVPDKLGISYMLIADIIIGKKAVGTSQKVLDTNNYTTMVDIIEKPNIFVVPLRYGSIPRYVVAFNANAR